MRKETKAHGLQQLVEGAFRKGVKTAMIDDTITTGGSTYRPSRRCARRAAMLPT